MLRARRQCRASLAQLGSRGLATGASSSGGGDGKGPKGKDFAIDFNALFKSAGNKAAEKKEGPAEPIDFKKLFSQTGSSSSSTSIGRKEGTVDNEKLKLDLSKLFGESSSTTKPGQGGLKGFKLDLSKLKSRGDQPSGGGLLKRTGKESLQDEAARREMSLQKLGVLSKFASVMGPGLTAVPPKDHLVEKYFSQDNMSKLEIRKIELAKIREEFRLHDTDCGSSPVQIALLTRKIKYLSQHFTVYKKDLHSRRGLNGMIQMRRKHLIYLRRKDWDMYCHVISRLGLKDNLEVPDAARKTTKKKKVKKNRSRKNKKKRTRSRA